MTEAVEKTVLGRPLRGEIQEPYSRTEEQWPDEQFLPLLDAVLNAEGVEGVRWHQYTPYFNDGEPCVFGLGELTVKLKDHQEDEDSEYEDGYLSLYEMHHYPNGYRGESVAYPQYESVYRPFSALGHAFGHFEIFLQKTFGDHAIITATKDGFDVEFYEHD